MINLGDLNTLTAASAYDYDRQNFVETGMGVLGATVVDIGVTMWNSLVPEATGYETSTAKVLQDMGADGALAAYNNNTDLVQGLSFVGGIFIPGGAALKLSRAVRSGMKGTSFLSPVRHKDDLLKFEKMIGEAKTGTAEYKKLRNSMYLRGQAENVLDTAAVEIALIGSFNAHPYMEDYMQDPLSNFGISMAIGGGIGAGISGALSRIELKGVQGAVESNALGSVNEAVALLDTPFSDTATSLANLNLASKRLDAISKMPDSPQYNRLSKEIAGNMSVSIRNRMAELMKTKISDDVLAVVEADTGVASSFIDRFSDLRMMGTDKVSFYKPVATGLKPTPALSSSSTPVFKMGTAADKKFVKTSYFNPDLNAFMTKSQADQIANAADLGFTPASIGDAANKLTFKRTINSFKDSLVGGRTGDIEASWLTNLKFYDRLKTKDLVAAEFVDGDLPAMQGWLVATEKRIVDLQSKISDPGNKIEPGMLDELVALKEAKIKVYSGDRVRLVNLDEVQGLEVPTNFADAVNYVKPTHVEDITKDIGVGAIRPIMKDTFTFDIATKASHMYYGFIARQLDIPVSRLDLHDIAPRKLEQYAKEFLIERPQLAKDLIEFTDPSSNLRPETALLLARWIGGNSVDKELFRNAMASARTLRHGRSSGTPFADEIANLINSPVVKAQQEALRKHASQKGDVFIYRGMSTKAKGDTPVSSYTFEKGIAKSFGDAHMYKVNVDDVVGYLYGGESEWLVGAAARDVTDKLPTGSAPRPRQASTLTFENLSFDQIKDKYISDKARSIFDEVKEGKISKEVIAARYNTTTEMVEIAGSNPDYLIDFYKKSPSEAGAQVDRWNSADKIQDALSPTRRTLQLTARESQITGPESDLLDLQRDSILGLANVDAQMVRAIEAGDNLATQRLTGKIAQIDDSLASINKLWVEASVKAEKSMMADQLLDNVIDAGEYKALREGLNQFVNGKGGNPLYSSADFVTSQMGEVGRLVTSIGDKINHYANESSTKFLDPIATEFRKLYKNDAARTEFAIIDNLRQSTPGELVYDEATRSLSKVIRDKKGVETKREPIPGGTIADESVHKVLIASQRAGEEVYKTQAVIARLSGKPRPQNIGLWMPSASLKNKEYAYIDNVDTRTRKLLIGNTSSELEEAIAAYKPAQGERVIRRSEAQAENSAIFSSDLERVYAADVTKQKKGISSAVPDFSSQRLDDIITGYRDRMHAQASAIVELSSFDLIKKLDYVSDFNKRTIGNQNKQQWRKYTEAFSSKDTALDIKDIMLGQNSAYRNELIKGVNAVGDTIIQGAVKAVNTAWDLARPFSGKQSQVDYDKYSAALRANGIENPFSAFEEAARPAMLERARTMGVSNPNRAVQIGNEIATTMALKFMEIAQPVVNMLSLPIMMTSTVNRAIVGANINGVKDLLDGGTMSIQMNGVRRAFATPAMDRGIMAIADREGLFDPILSEVDAVMKMSKFSSGGPGASIEKALDSTFVKMMSKPSELTEGLVRKVAFATGVETARRIYKTNATDKEIFIYARDFMKQAIGNYSTAQRPMMFQGSVGAAMGLFQTYMLTYAQNLYRHLEIGDYKGIGKTMLAQGGIFGAGSLPGFQPISETIAENFSDDNFDLTTGTYRALPDELASILIYGMPSNLGPALHTRGDVAPRIPTGFDTMVAPSMIGQALGSMIDVGKAAARMDASVGQAFFEALSTQSVSRPVARLSELATGYSVDGARQQIAGPEDVWSFTGIMSRVMSTRPLSETKLRESNYLNSHYGSIDRENRSAIIQRAREAIRSDTLTTDMMDDMAIAYMRTGSPQGFRSAINQAFMDQEQSRVEVLRGQFKDSPLMLIIDDLD